MLAGDIARRVGEQEATRLGDFCGLRDAPHGNAGHGALDEFGTANDLRHGGLDRAETHAVHTDAKARPFARCTHGDAEYAGFGCAVIDLTDGAAPTRNRRHIDDASRRHLTRFCLCQHVTTDRLQTMKHAAEIDVDDSLPIGQRHLVNHGGADDAGVVEQAVDSAMLGRDGLNHGLHEGRVGHAADMHLDLRADQLGGFARAVAIDIDQREARTKTRGFQRDTATNALRGTGDDDHASVEIHRIFHSNKLSAISTTRTNSQPAVGRNSAAMDGRLAASGSRPAARCQTRSRGARRWL